MKLDPQARTSFLGKMQQYDPNGVFMNDFGRRLKGIDTKINTDPLSTRCALLDNCVCSKNNDCGPTQTCSRIDGYPDYPVCKSPGNVLQILDPNPNIPLNMSISDLLASLLDGVLG